MDGEVRFDKKQFVKALEEFSRETGISTHDVLKDQMRLFVKACDSMTPPKKAAVGKQSIDKSLSTIFGVIDDKDALEQLDLTFGNRLFPLQFDMHPAEMMDYHNKMRTGSTGRTPSKQPARAGGVPFGRKPYVLKRDLKRYAAARKKKVGRLRAGWNRAAQVFGFVPAKWVQQHGKAEGAAKDAFKPETLEGYMEATNQVPYAGRHKRIPEVAMKGRVRALTTRLNKELERIARAKSAR